MDLKLQPAIKTTWTHSPTTDELVITFKTEDELTTLGNITIEGVRFLSLNDSLKQIAVELLKNISLTGQRTVFDAQTLKGTTEFDA